MRKSNPAAAGQFSEIVLTVNDMMDAEIAFHKIVKFSVIDGVLGSKLNKIRRIIHNTLEPYEDTRKSILGKCVEEYEKDNTDADGKLPPEHKGRFEHKRFDDLWSPVGKQKECIKFIQINGDEFWYENSGGEKINRFGSNLNSTAMDGIGQYTYAIDWAISEPAG